MLLDAAGINFVGRGHSTVSMSRPKPVDPPDPPDPPPQLARMKTPARTERPAAHLNRVVFMACLLFRPDRVDVEIDEGLLRDAAAGAGNGERVGARLDPDDLAA